MSDQEVLIEGRALTLTNLEKVFWPRERITKGALLSYYDQIASYILPYLKDRPQSLNRFPDGINGESFFQKNLPDLPKWFQTYKQKDKKGKETTYALCNDRASLMYLVNLGCIELNVWNSTFQRPKEPDYLVIDLDPTGASYELVRQVALEFHRLLSALEVIALPKTSGKKGLHIYIPLRGHSSYRQVRDLAHLMALKVNASLPDITSLERLPRDRRGKIYLDYLQNRRGATMAAPYCVRPVPGATVSMPLTWAEVKNVNPRNFNIGNALARLQERGDLFGGIFGEGVSLNQLLARLK